MGEIKMKRIAKKKEIKQYNHKGKERVNNPPVGLVTTSTDPNGETKTYEYDPHLDPQLTWASKDERTSFEVPIKSLHVHERIDPNTIIDAVRKYNGKPMIQISLFEQEHLPLRKAIQFYKHKHNWSNRLIAGDSLLVMNSLLEKEGMGEKVQMIYFDPAYGIKYSSNFQPFVSKRDVTDRKDEDLTTEPEMIKAYRDIWELGIHSWCNYIRDNVLLANKMLDESGSFFLQINDENIHYAREIIEEIFGRENFVSMITFTKTRAGFKSNYLTGVCDYILWYAKDKSKLKIRKLYTPKNEMEELDVYTYMMKKNGEIIKCPKDKEQIKKLLNEGAELFMSDNLVRSNNPEFSVKFNGKIYTNRWRTNPKGMEELIKNNRIFATKNLLRYIFKFKDFPVKKMGNVWAEYIGASDKIYVVQTNNKIVERCMLLSTDPGDLVLDITGGSGTTAYVAEQWGRRWISCDTSRIAIILAKQRIMTATYSYFKFRDELLGVSGGFIYNTVSHVSLKSITNEEGAERETLYDQPEIDKSITRISGPFTYEAAPSPTVRPLSEIKQELPADESIARNGETIHQTEWKDELLKTGIRAKGGKKIEFSYLEEIPSKWIDYSGETKEEIPRKVVVSFGSEYAPMDRKQVERVIQETRTLAEKPKMIVFASFQFDPEAAKDIDETQWPEVTLIKVQMNADLLVQDLKKKRSSEDSFWMIGQPDAEVIKIKKGENKGKYKVKVLGFDYYNPITGNIESGGENKIAMWMLDTDYDGRSLFPKQVFFPMKTKNDWTRLARTLKAEIDQEKVKAYERMESLPFEADNDTVIAIKVVDDRGIESLKIVDIKDIKK